MPTAKSSNRDVSSRKLRRITKLLGIKADFTKLTWDEIEAALLGNDERNYAFALICGLYIGCLRSHPNPKLLRKHLRQVYRTAGRVGGSITIAKRLDAAAFLLGDKAIGSERFWRLVAGVE